MAVLRTAWRKINKYLKRNSIKASMILNFMSLIAIIVVFLSVASVQNTINETESLAINYTARLLSEVNSSIDSYIDNMKSMGGVVVENGDVKELMALLYKSDHEPLSREEQELCDEMENRAAELMDTVAKTRSDITNIALLSVGGDVILSDVDKNVNIYSDYQQADWYLEALKNADEVISPSHVQNLIEGEYKWVISISKRIVDPGTREVVGVMLIDLNYRSIERIFEDVQMGKGGYIYLIDAENNFIFHPQQQLINAGLRYEYTGEIFEGTEDRYVRFKDKNRIYMLDDSDVTGWSAIGVVNTTEIISNRGYINAYYIVLAVISIVFAALSAIIISTNITGPIKNLESVMHRVEEGDLNVRAEIESDNEIGHVSKTFNSMVNRVKLLMESEISKEEAKRKSEILALQAQINPHFLYNTLETIIWMSAKGKNDEVVQVTSALAQLFRSSISRDESLVRLAVEIEHVESYLTIQKMRYKDKLHYSIDISEEMGSLMVPKLILQPIVENAIYHGLKPLSKGGDVMISAKRRRGELVITVEDSGVGMSTEKMESILQSEESDSIGIGVQNVNDRIKLVFGERYGLEYYKGEKSGTKVKIRLPIVHQGEE